MNKKFNFKNFIENLLNFSPRQLEGEKKAADFIISFLKKNHFSYYVDYFLTKVPKIERAILKADNKKIPCKGCSFVSGKIKDKDYLISSLIPSRFFLEKPNINFNPKCDGISLSNFYFAPALAVSKRDLDLILRAKRVEGEVKIKRIKYKARNILVGNLKNPKIICFAHYDSIEKGAVDNASGVAVIMAAIISHPEIIKNNLFVFSANEELSYDKPTYWGYGFRSFENKFFKIMKLSKEILVVDCVGNDRAKVFKDENSIYLAFPIKNKEKFKDKIKIISGGFDNLMEIYHSDLDDIKRINENYLMEGVRMILNHCLLRL
jgi:hypothetical protein